jgi:hypothetical protein
MDAKVGLAPSRRGGLSMAMVAVVAAVLAALLLGGAVGYQVRGLTLSAAGLPARASQSPLAGNGGPAWSAGSRRSGTQAVDDQAAPVVSSHTLREPGSQRGGLQIVG